MKIINLTTIENKDKNRIYKTWLLCKQRCVPYFDNVQVKSFIGLIFRISIEEINEIIKEYSTERFD